MYIKIVIFFLQIINIYIEVVQIVDFKFVLGKFNILWVEFVKFYEKVGQIEDVRNFLKSDNIIYVFFIIFLILLFYLCFNYY